MTAGYYGLLTLQNCIPKYSKLYTLVFKTVYLGIQNCIPKYSKLYTFGSEKFPASLSAATVSGLSTFGCKYCRYCKYCTVLPAPALTGGGRTDERGEM